MVKNLGLKIGLDVMGGDYAPEAVVDGVVAYQQSLSSSHNQPVLVLVGPAEQTRNLLLSKGVNPDVFEFVEATEQITMADSPVRALMEKKKSSIVVGLTLLAQGHIQSFASAGNTGAMLAGGFKIVGNVQGVIRPSLVSLLPKIQGGSNILLDVGANTDCRSDVLVQFAKLGTIYAREVCKIKNPKVALLNIGEEESKGTPVIREAYKMLQEDRLIEFIGNIEGRDLYTGPQDVTVCDGLVGNIVLKQTEAFYEILRTKNLHQDAYFESMNFENFGGTVILGLKAPVIIGHGISKTKAIKNMILFSIEVAKAKLSKIIENAFLSDLSSEKDVPVK